MTRDEAIGRIRRLLRLGNDAAASPAEAEQALSRAMALSQQYHVDAAALAASDAAEEPIEHRRIEVGLRFSFNRKKAAVLCQKFFQVEAVISTPDVVFIGMPSDLVIAEYVFDYVAGAASRALSAWVKGRRLAISTRANWMTGFYLGIHQTLEAARQDAAAASPENAFALAVFDRLAARRKAYLNKMFPPATLKVGPIGGNNRYNRNAVWAGYVRGKDVQIRPGLNGNRPPAPQLARPAQALLEL